MRNANRLFFATLLVAILTTSIQGLEVSPLHPVGPRVERWGWDIKAWPARLDSRSGARRLFGDTAANLLRVPIFANAHGEDGSVDDAEYQTELRAINRVKEVKPEVEVFASLKLLGANTYPDWLGDGTADWPGSNGRIFSNTVERPNPEHYSKLLADYVEYLQESEIQIDYLGLNNETDTALDVSRYIATIDLLEEELIAREVPEQYRSFQYVGPETFGMNSAENIVRSLANRNRLDTVDVVGSHFYPQHNSGHESSWSDIAQITSGAPMWHTEVHMPIGNSKYSGDPQQAYRDTLSLLFAVNKRGADSFVWWDSGHERNKVNDTIKREVVNTMLDARAVETTPGFTAKSDRDDEPLYQALVQEDLLTLWIANPGDTISDEVLDLTGATAISAPTSTYWQGTSNTIRSSNSGSLDIAVNDNGDELLIRDIPGDATMFLQFRFALGEGDYNRDGFVDLADYGLWKDTFGSTEDLMADGNRDGRVDGADFTLWRDALTSTPMQALVPEPSSNSMLFVWAMVGYLCLLQSPARRRSLGIPSLDRLRHFRPPRTTRSTTRGRDA